jgi:hypothetical protein
MWQTGIFVAICAALVLMLCLVLTALRRGRRLEKRIESLHQSVQTLINADQIRFLRGLRGPPKADLPE